MIFEVIMIIVGIIAALSVLLALTIVGSFFYNEIKDGNIF